MPDPNLRTVFASFLRRQQQGLGATQTQMATKLGTAQSTYSELQSGDANVTASTIDHTLDALGIDLAAFCRSLLNHETSDRRQPVHPVALHRYLR